MPKPGEHYRHYKGNVYEIVCLATNEADLVPVVVYRALNDPTKTWVRALGVFTEEVEVDGTRVPRFARL